MSWIKEQKDEEEVKIMTESNASRIPTVNGERESDSNKTPRNCFLHFLKPGRILSTFIGKEERVDGGETDGEKHYSHVKFSE